VFRGREEDKYTLRRGCQSVRGGEYIETDTLRKMTARIASANAGMAGFSGEGMMKRLATVVPALSLAPERNNYRTALTGVLSARPAIDCSIESIPRCCPRACRSSWRLYPARLSPSAQSKDQSVATLIARHRASACIHCGNFFFPFTVTYSVCSGTTPRYEGTRRRRDTNLADLLTFQRHSERGGTTWMKRRRIVEETASEKPTEFRFCLVGNFRPRVPGRMPVPSRLAIGGG